LGSVLSIDSVHSKRKSEVKLQPSKSRRLGTCHPEIPNQRLRNLSGSEPGNYKTKTPRVNPTRGAPNSFPICVWASRCLHYRVRTASDSPSTMNGSRKENFSSVSKLRGNSKPHALAISCAPLLGVRTDRLHGSPPCLISSCVTGGFMNCVSSVRCITIPSFRCRIPISTEQGKKTPRPT